MLWVQERHKSNRAHRVSWEIFEGAVPGELLVLHKCDNPPCVRPDHLFLGTSVDNMHDKALKGRAPRGSSSPAAKLAESQVQEIRRRFAAGGVTMTELGCDFRVHPCNISNIIKKRIWRHVDSDLEWAAGSGCVAPLVLPTPWILEVGAYRIVESGGEFVLETQWSDALGEPYWQRFGVAKKRPGIGNDLLCLVLERLRDCDRDEAVPAGRAP